MKEQSRSCLHGARSMLAVPSAPASLPPFTPFFLSLSAEDSGNTFAEPPTCSPHERSLSPHRGTGVSFSLGTSGAPSCPSGSFCCPSGDVPGRRWGTLSSLCRSRNGIFPPSDGMGTPAQAVILVGFFMIHLIPSLCSINRFHQGSDSR